MTTTTATPTPPAPDVTYTGRVNGLGNELCVVASRSDWGEAGWMICEEIRIPGREPFRTPKVFHRGSGEDTKTRAIHDARTGHFYGYLEA